MGKVRKYYLFSDKKKRNTNNRKRIKKKAFLSHEINESDMEPLLNRYGLESKKPHSVVNYEALPLKVKCPEQESNLHILANGRF